MSAMLSPETALLRRRALEQIRDALATLSYASDGQYEDVAQVSLDALDWLEQELTGRLSPMTEVATPVEARASLPVSQVTRLRALEVLGDTDTWTGSDWQHAATLLASAIVSLTDDLAAHKQEQTP